MEAHAGELAVSPISEPLIPPPSTTPHLSHQPHDPGITHSQIDTNSQQPLHIELAGTEATETASPWRSQFNRASSSRGLIERIAVFHLPPSVMDGTTIDSLWLEWPTVVDFSGRSTGSRGGRVLRCNYRATAVLGVVGYGERHRIGTRRWKIRPQLQASSQNGCSSPPSSACP